METSQNIEFLICQGWLSSYSDLNVPIIMWYIMTESTYFFPSFFFKKAFKLSFKFLSFKCIGVTPVDQRPGMCRILAGDVLSRGMTSWGCPGAVGFALLSTN